MIGFQSELIELQEAQLKDIKFDIEKIVNEKIMFEQDQYQPKTVLYNDKINSYVQVKKWDDANKVYVCKIKKQNEE